MFNIIVGFSGRFGLVLLLFWCCQPSFAQYRYRLQYDMLLNLGEYRQYTAELYAGSHHALFRYHAVVEHGQEDVNSRDSLSMSFQFKLSDTSRYFIFSDRLKDSITQLDRIPGEATPCLIMEVFPAIHWKLTGDRRTIGQLECSGAVGHFKGRNYTAWFSKDLPAYFGPWKLHGLPGLILEVYDETGEIGFYVRKIESLDLPVDSLIFSPAGLPYPVLDRQEYIKRFKRYIDVLESRMITKFGRGFRVTTKSSPIKSIEIYDQ